MSLPRTIAMLQSPLGGVGHALAAGFPSLGSDVHVFEPDGTWNLSGCDRIVLYGPMQSIYQLARRLSKYPELPPTLMWFTEQAPNPSLPWRLTLYAARVRLMAEHATIHPLGARFWPPGSRLPLLQRAGRLRALGEVDFLRRARRLSALAAFSQTTTRLLECTGTPCYEVPIGYAPWLGEDLHQERDIDVVFLGNAQSTRRRAWLARVSEHLAARGVDLTVVDGSGTRGSVYGAERTAMLNRSKIMLHIGRSRWDDAVFRILLASANGVMVVSETLLTSSHGPFRPSEHFVAAPLDDISDTISYFVHHKAERESMVARAANLVTESLTMEKMSERFLSIAAS